ncbi:flavodoxin family protein [Streptomyces sp. NPDC005728]|uniref:flavodoxin family protein n=1 Tax=Streptomyces sp. NPDC005728 TaxID=3157054 RepID=UPI0033DFDAC5
MSHRIAVVYHSRRGTVRALAALAAEGAREAGAEVRLVRVADDGPSGRGWPERVAEPEDVVWADGLVLAGPTYYGNVSSPFKRFLESTAPLWRQGLLADRVATGITVSTQRHGGREATLMALHHTLYHWGCWVAGADPADPVTRAAGGTPYGLAADNRQGEPAPHERAAARALGRRLAALTARARAAPTTSPPLTPTPAQRPPRPAPTGRSDATGSGVDALRGRSVGSGPGVVAAGGRSGGTDPGAVAAGGRRDGTAPGADCPSGRTDASGSGVEALRGRSVGSGPGVVAAGGRSDGAGAGASVLAGCAQAAPGADPTGLTPPSEARFPRAEPGGVLFGGQVDGVARVAHSGLLDATPCPVRLAVVYHGADAATRILAQEAAAAARSVGARVRLRRVPGGGGARPAEWLGPWAAPAAPEDIAWADAVLFGGRVRLGALAAPLLDFVQTLEPAEGGRSPLWGKAASGFATTPAPHAGSETAVLDLGHMLLHAGAVLVPPGYTDPAVEAAGGNPYGASHPRSAGDLPTPETIAAAAHQGRRTALAGDLLRRAPLPRGAARQDTVRTDPEPVRLVPRTIGRSTA